MKREIPDKLEGCCDRPNQQFHKWCRRCVWCLLKNGYHVCRDEACKPAVEEATARAEILKIALGLP